MKWNEMIHYFICHHKAYRECLDREQRARERKNEWKSHTAQSIHLKTHVKIIWTSCSLSNKIQIKHNEKTYAITIKRENFFIWFDLSLKWPFSSALLFFSRQIDWLTEQVPFGDKHFELNDTYSTLNVFIGIFSISISIFLHKFFIALNANEL